MKQHQAVIQALDNLGGIATLAQLYRDALKIPGCEWKTKTPLASIRRIVQMRPEIFKIRPGLYGLVSRRQALEASGIIAETETNRDSEPVRSFGHTYYQGLLLILGKLKHYDCWAPNQDKNKKFLNTTIDALRTVREMPPFSYPRLVSRSATVDVVWFNERRMPSGFFEVEDTTDFQNSLLKLNDLQDFSARMLIVSDARRRREFEATLGYSAFREIAGRAKFLTYDWLVKEYEHAVEASQAEVTI